MTTFVTTFRVKNLAPFPITVMGQSMYTNQSLDLLLTQTASDIKSSLLFGELYDKLMGRMIAITHPTVDIAHLGFSDSEYNLLTYAGFFQSHLGSDDLKYPIQFTNDGYLLATVVSGSVPSIVSARGIKADGTVADGYPLEMGAIDPSGNIQSLLVDTDGYLMTSTFVETTSEIEGRVFGGEIGTGIKPVIISGIDSDGYSRSILVSSDGEISIRGYDAPADAVRTYETAPVNTTFLLEELVNTTNLSVDTYYYTVTMDNYKDLSIEFELDSVSTMTIEASNDSGFTTPKDITLSGNELVSGTNGYVSFNNSDGIVDFDNLNVSYVRVKLVISNATNTVKIISRKKAL